jgi:methylmalonyl-CoA/ethylmalonyl-CoA epimerase
MANDLGIHGLDLNRLPTRIDHVGVIVEDLSAAVEHFSTHYGLEVVAREEIVAAGADVAYLAIKDAPEGDLAVTIQFLQPLREGPVLSYFTAHGPGTHHICFEVPSLERFVEGLPFPGEQEPNIIKGGRGRRTCFLRDDSHGFVVELCER